MSKRFTACGIINNEGELRSPDSLIAALAEEIKATARSGTLVDLKPSFPAWEHAIPAPLSADLINMICDLLGSRMAVALNLEILGSLTYKTPKIDERAPLVLAAMLNHVLGMHPNIVLVGSSACDNLCSQFQIDNAAEERNKKFSESKIAADLNEKARALAKRFNSRCGTVARSAASGSAEGAAARLRQP